MALDTPERPKSWVIGSNSSGAGNLCGRRLALGSYWGVPAFLCHHFLGSFLQRPPMFAECLFT